MVSHGVTKKDSFSPLKFSKTCMTIESKVLALPGIIYSMHVDVIYVTTIKYRDIQYVTTIE